MMGFKMKKINDVLSNVLYGRVIPFFLKKSKLGRECLKGNSDRGVNFDYMYENKPSGDTILEKIIDNYYLNLPAVKATRNRKNTLIEYIVELAQRKANSNQPFTLVDIASGPSRYSIESAEILRDMNIGFKAYCLDSDISSIELGNQLSEERGLSENVRYKLCDVMDENQLKYHAQNPDFIIVSGLYVYLDDEKVSKSLELLSDISKEGTKILVDNQISNPSQELMEKTLKQSGGKPWKLEYRTEESMKSLVSKNFNILKSWVDDINMYHFILAENNLGGNYSK